MMSQNSEISNAKVNRLGFPEFDVEMVEHNIDGLILGWTLHSPERPFSIKPMNTFPTENVEQCKSKLAESLHTEFDRSIYLNQTHGEKIALIESQNNSSENESLGISSFDSAITKIIGTQLNLSLADCAGVLICNPEHRTISTVHSGWRGTQQSIAEKAIRSMAEVDGCWFEDYVKNIQIWFTPSASMDKYEVGVEFMEFFPKSTLRVAGKYYFDNQLEISQRLLGLGVPLSSISLNRSCTISNPNYHSHRRDGDQSGRINAFIKLEK